MQRFLFLIFLLLFIRFIIILFILLFLPRRDTPMLNPNLGPLDCDNWDRHFLERLCSLSADEVAQFVGHIAATSSRTGLDYIKDSGERIIIPVTYAPVLFTPMILAGLRTAFTGLASAVAKVAAAWLDSPQLQRVLPLEPYEAEWLRLARHAPGNQPAQVFHRWDFALNVSGDPSAEHFKLFEVNSVDVGGIHYSAATREVMAEALRQLGTLGWTDTDSAAGSDPRKILYSALEEHSRQLGHPLHQVAIAENQDFTTGITEAESICQYFRKHAFVADCVDVRKFEIDSQHKVGYAGHAVDVIYRNIEWRDLADLEAAGGDASGLRTAAKAGKLLSSPFGELDHKSLWEVLGSPEFSDLFSPTEKNLIAKHIPWTRLLRERTTTDATGQSIELIPFVRSRQSDLAMKPNRSCGGQGVTIGRIASAADWERTLDSALQSPGTWIVQEYIPIPRRRTRAACQRTAISSPTKYSPSTALTVRRPASACAAAPATARWSTSCKAAACSRCWAARRCNRAIHFARPQANSPKPSDCSARRRFAAEPGQAFLPLTKDNANAGLSM